jgi:hypothetical protein
MTAGAAEVSAAQQSEGRWAGAAAAIGALGAADEDMWQQLQWQVTLGNSEEWADTGPVRRWFRKVRGWWAEGHTSTVDLQLMLMFEEVA